jgi:hypothetical protein
MSKLKQPLRVWHGLLAIVAALAVGAAGTAIAGGGPGDEITTAEVGPVGFVKSGKYRYGFKSRTVPSGDSQRTTRLRCPRRTKVIGGGGGFSSQPGEQSILWNGPFDSSDRDLKPENGWRIFVNSIRAEGGEGFSVWAICAKRG